MSDVSGRALLAHNEYSFPEVALVALWWEVSHFTPFQLLLSNSLRFGWEPFGCPSQERFNRCCYTSSVCEAQQKQPHSCAVICFPQIVSGVKALVSLSDHNCWPIVMTGCGLLLLPCCHSGFKGNLDMSRCVRWHWCSLLDCVMWCRRLLKWHFYLLDRRHGRTETYCTLTVHTVNDEQDWNTGRDSPNMEVLDTRIWDHFFLNCFHLPEHQPVDVVESATVVHRWENCTKKCVCGLSEGAARTRWEEAGRLWNGTGLQSTSKRRQSWKTGVVDHF